MLLNKNPIHISVIVPVYNAEQFINRCIQSILSQSFDKFELILIDDGSRDSSLKLCQKFSEIDHRVKVIQKPNGGVSSARNVGIKLAQGKYIAFIDSDDYIKKDYLKNLLFDENISDDTLIIQDTTYDIDGQTFSMDDNKLEYYYSKLDNEVNHYKFLMAGPPYAKLLSLHLIRKNQIFFNEQISLNEDHLFHLEYLLHINSVRKVAGADYIYVKGNVNSLSLKKYSFEELVFGLDLMIPLTERVLFKYNINKREIVLNLYSCVISRILLTYYSLYQPPYNKTKKERLQLINLLKSKYGYLFKSFYVHKTVVQYFLYYIICSKQNFFTDMFLTLVFKIKRLTNFLKHLKNKSNLLFRFKF